MCLRHKHQPEPSPVEVSHCSLKEPKLNAHGKGYCCSAGSPSHSLLHAICCREGSTIWLWGAGYLYEPAFQRECLPPLSRLPCLPGIKLFWSSLRIQGSLCWHRAGGAKLLLRGRDICLELIWVCNTEVSSKLISPAWQSWGLHANKAVAWHQCGQALLNTRHRKGISGSRVAAG